MSEGRGLAAKCCFPEARREFGDAAGGVFADPLQHIDQVGVWIDAVEPAGDDQALDDAYVLRPEFGPAEEPGLAPHRHNTQRSFKVIGVDRNVRIGPTEISRPTRRWRT